MSCIPAGTYGGILRYDHSDQWRIELKDTDPRTNIQIHIGNFPRDTKGCILPGMAVNNAAAQVLDSGPAYSKLKAAFYGSENPVSTPNTPITLAARYNVRPTEFIVRDPQVNEQAIYRQQGTAWLLYSKSENGRHVWNESKRTDKHIYFSGQSESGFWSGREITVPLHGGGSMYVRRPGGQWTTFGQGTQIIRQDGTSAP